MTNKDYHISNNKIYHCNCTNPSDPTISHLLSRHIRGYLWKLKYGKVALDKLKKQLDEFIKVGLPKYIQQAADEYGEICDRDKILIVAEEEDNPIIYEHNKKLGLNPKDFEIDYRLKIEQVRHYKCPKCNQYEVYVMGFAVCNNCNWSSL